jgi:hypothetical protein
MPENWNLRTNDKTLEYFRKVRAGRSVALYLALLVREVRSACDRFACEASIGAFGRNM